VAGVFGCRPAGSFQDRPQENQGPFISCSVRTRTGWPVWRAALQAPAAKPSTYPAMVTVRPLPKVTLPVPSAMSAVVRPCGSQDSMGIAPPSAMKRTVLLTLE
jgi:hypothetical protein